MSGLCKFYKVVRQVSYDSGVTWVNIGETQKGDLYEYNSPECGGSITQYRWVDVTGAYTCEGTTKYQKTKRQYSEDGGQTWQDVSPAEYGKSSVIEYYSEDCGGGGDYQGQYFTFVSINDGKYMFSNNRVSYSIDEGNTWSTLASDTYSPTVYAGQKIMWKGNLTPNSDFGIGTFSSTNRFNVEGNAMSLLYGDNFTNETSLEGKDYAFGWLFSGNTKVVSAKNLVLPAATLAPHCYAWMFAHCTSLITMPSLPATTLAENCYSSMFFDCTSLTTAPVLPATTLAERCYLNMFAACSSLTTVPSNMLSATTLAEGCYWQMFWTCSSLIAAPELPATTLANSCYRGMFTGCKKLTTAPVLPATTLAEKCYSSMFWDCSSLNYIKCLATNISATDCTKEWVYKVSSSGTFIKNSSMSGWTRGVNGIPTNWSVQNA